MKFKTQTHRGIFLKRYKRFFADVLLKVGQNEETVVAHVANTGSMKSAAVERAICLVSEAENPERKLRYTLEAIQSSATGSWIGVNTSWPNHLAKEAFEKKVFSHWSKFDQIQSEVKINSETRLDLLLSNAQKKHYVEIKNVSMAVSASEGEKNLVAQFPDAVTERGQKHLRELMNLVEQGHEAEILFTVQRTDCQSFSPADQIDPEYGRLLREAQGKGVQITVAIVEINDQEVLLSGKILPLKL